MKRTHIAIGLALITAGLVAMAGVGVASHTVDTSTSDATATQSETTDGATITYNESTDSTLQVNGTAANTSFEILQDGYTLSEYENESSPEEITVVNAAEDHLNLTLADDETGYTGIEAGAGENVTLTYRVYNDSSLDNPEEINLTVHWENDGNKSFIRGDSDATETADPSFAASTLASVPLIGTDSDNVTDPALVEHDIGVNGDDQDEITIWIEESAGEDAVTETYDDADAASAVSYKGWVTVDGAFVPVLASEDDAPDWLDTDSQAYAIVESDGNKVVVHNAGDKLGSDTENAKVQVASNEPMNIFEIAGMLDEYGASTLTKWTTAVGGEVSALDDQFEVAS